MNAGISAMDVALLILHKLGEVEMRRLRELTYVAAKASGVAVEEPEDGKGPYSPEVIYGLEIALEAGFMYEKRIQNTYYCGLTNTGKAAAEILSKKRADLREKVEIAIYSGTYPSQEG